MVDCPKCGFNQPQDRYCANCGVDMVTFVPAAKPLFRRIISNVAVQICVIAGIVFTVFLIVRHQQRMEVAARVAELEDSTPKEIIEANTEKKPPRRKRRERPTPVAAALPEETPAAAAEEPPTDMRSAETRSAMTVSAPASAAKAPIKPSDENADPTENAPPVLSSSIRVSFNEVPRAAADSFNTEVSGSYGTIRFGVVNDWAARSKTARTLVNWRTLDTSSPQSIRSGETTTVFRGPHVDATGESFGLWIYTKLVKVEESSVTIQIDVSRNLTNPGSTGGIEQINHLPLPEVTVPRGAAMFVTGLIPHRQTPLTSAEQRLYRQDRVLQVMTSEPFRASATDFVVFVEPIQQK